MIFIATLVSNMNLDNLTISVTLRPPGIKYTNVQINVKYNVDYNLYYAGVNCDWHLIEAIIKS